MDNIHYHIFIHFLFNRKKPKDQVEKGLDWGGRALTSGSSSAPGWLSDLEKVTQPSLGRRGRWGAGNSVTGWTLKPLQVRAFYSNVVFCSKPGRSSSIFLPAPNSPWFLPQETPKMSSSLDASKCGRMRSLCVSLKVRREHGSRDHCTAWKTEGTRVLIPLAHPSSLPGLQPTDERRAICKTRWGRMVEFGLLPCLRI